MKLSCVAVAVLLQGAPPDTGSSEAPPPNNDAQAYVDRGDRYFDAKEFDKAVAEYTAALALSPHPDLIWNIARASEETGRYPEALALFERYLPMAPTEADKQSAQGKIAALTKRVAKGRITVTTEAGASVRVGGVEVGLGPVVTRPVSPGRYRISATLVGRTSSDTFVTVEPGEQVDIRVDFPAPAVPIAPAPEPTSWAGTYRLVASDAGEIGQTLDGAAVQLDAAGQGRATKPMARTLEPWRRQHCAPDHGDTLTWTAHYDVSLNVDGPASSLVFDQAEAEECSCPPFCRFPERFEVPALLVPTYRGIVTESVVFVRGSVSPEGLGRQTLTPVELAGEWTPILWPAAPSSGAALTLGANGVGALTTATSGALLSWQRRQCGDRPDWSQTLAYPVTVTIVGPKLHVAFGPGRETTCSCPGQCAAPAALAAFDVWMPLIGDTLVAPQTLWIRRPAPALTPVGASPDRAP